jgi:hypothetical protein
VRSRRLRETLQELPETASPAEIVEHTQYDCVNSAKRDMVAILRHARDVGAAISPDAASALDHLEPFSASGGQVLTSGAGVFLVSKIPINFRVAQTGEAMNALYGGGQGGLNLFLKTLRSEIAGDPSFVPDHDAVAYLDSALSSAWQEASATSSDPTDWDELYREGSAANPRLLHFKGPYLLGDDSPAGLSYTPPTLQCADGATIWSQRAETYTQIVDLGTVDDSLTMIPPGNTEGPDDAYWIAQGNHWAAGTLLPAPLSAAAVDAIAVETTTLYYEDGASLPPPRHPTARRSP